MAAPTLDTNGIPVFLKDPDDINKYKGNVTQELLDRGTTAASVTEIVMGVVVDLPSTLEVVGDQTWCVVRLKSLDVAANPVNQCTWRVVCANGEQFDRTIKFTRKDK